ncbi:hypothetical protein H9Q69_003721 [Fusarium xylarioides]|nr:hypothetical protein H9Q69_003721 [Fusarium xylarioides]
MSEFGDIPSVVIDTAIGELPDQRKAATIRRWLVQVHEKAADKERQASDREGQAAQALQEIESRRSRLEEKEKELESGKAALDQERARIARVAEELPNQLSKTVKDASAAWNDTMSSTSEVLKGLKSEVTEAGKKASGVLDRVSALPSKSNLQEWVGSRDEEQLQNIRTLVSESMEKLKAQYSSEHSVELEQLRVKYEAQCHEVSKLEGVKIALNEELQSLQRKDRENLVEITDLRAGCESKDQRITNLEGEKGSMQQELGSLRSTDSDRAGELNQLHSQCEDMEKEVSRLQEGKASLDAEVKALRSSERDSSSTLGGLRAECAAKDQVVAVLRAEKKALEQEVQKLLGSLDERVKTSANLQAQYTASGQEVSKLQQKSQDLVGKVEKLKTENTGLLQEVARLQANGEFLEEKARKCDSLSAELRDMRKTLQDSEIEIGVLHNRIKRREDECERSTKWREEVREQNMAAREAVKENETYIQELEGRVQLTDEEKEELVQARSRLHILQLQMDHVKELLQQATEARGKSEKDCNALKQEIIKANEDMKSWHDRSASVSEMHAKAEEALGKQLDVAHRELGEERAQNDKLKARLATLSKESWAKDSELEKVRSQLVTLQGELGDERRRVDTFGGLGENVKSILERLESTQRLQGELSDTRSLLKEAEHRLTAYEATGQGFASELAKMYSILAEAFNGLPTAPGGNGSFRMHYVATRIAPMLIAPGAKDNLEAFLRRKSSNWHCFEQVVLAGPFHGDVGQGQCSRHVTGCVLVCVVSYSGQDLLMFRER